MQNLFILIIWELKILNKANNFIKSYLSLFLLYILSVALTCNQDDMINSGLVFAIIYAPVSLIGFCDQIFRQDVEEGYLELLLNSFVSSEIILAKYCSLFLTVCACCCCCLPIIALAFNISPNLIIILFCILLLIFALACGMIILVSSIQAYFRHKTNLLQILIMFMIIPSIIIAGVILHSHAYYLFLVLLGIDMILIPIILFLSSFLIKNVYSFE
ncbi:MAG: hypothetical protein EOP33_01545 [Rickettsiaceae bacterium]|nr:MAG: hypothetical protein EOP33_01545 [Rickettsiaceae bacterium]